MGFWVDSYFLSALEKCCPPFSRPPWFLTNRLFELFVVSRSLPCLGVDFLRFILSGVYSAWKVPSVTSLNTSAALWLFPPPGIQLIYSCHHWVFCGSSTCPGGHVHFLLPVFSVVQVVWFPLFWLHSHWFSSFSSILQLNPSRFLCWWLDFQFWVSIQFFISPISLLRLSSFLLFQA